MVNFCILLIYPNTIRFPTLLTIIGLNCGPNVILLKFCVGVGAGWSSRLKLATPFVGGVYVWTAKLTTPFTGGVYCGIY